MIYFIVFSGLTMVLYSMWLFDKLVRWEYDNHHAQWERDGKPDGYFWAPAPYSMQSDSAKQWLSILWVLKTPKWAMRKPCYCWLVQSRIIMLIILLFVVPISGRLMINAITFLHRI